MNQETHARIRATLVHLIALLVEQKYGELETLSKGVRLRAGHVRAAVSEYGQVLVFPPQESFDSIDVVPIKDSDPGEYSIRLPLHTTKQGKSDLELQATLIDDPGKGNLMRVEIDSILVP